MLNRLPFRFPFSPASQLKKAVQSKKSLAALYGPWRPGGPVFPNRTFLSPIHRLLCVKTVRISRYYTVGSAFIRPGRWF